MKCAFYNKAQKEAINKITLQTFLSNTKFVFYDIQRSRQIMLCMLL